MAASKGINKKAQPGYYQQLNESINWFLEPVKPVKKSSGPYYPVERLITKRIVKKNVSKFAIFSHAQK